MQQSKSPNSKLNTLTKVIKSFDELNKINRRDLYSGEKLKPLDKKFAVSFARQLATGFDKVKLNKEPSKRQYTKARKVIEEWYDSQRSGKTKLIRPSAKNRKYYAEFSDMPENFKIYHVPILEKDDKFKINRKKAKIIRSGSHINTEDYLYPDRVKFVKNISKETDKLIKDIDRDYKNKIKEVHIRVGKHQTNARYNKNKIKEELEKWAMIYDPDHMAKFVMGLRIFTFNGQQAIKPSKLKRKKGK